MLGKKNHLYDSFLGKSLVNSQKTKLIKKFEFSTGSWLADQIVEKFNEKMETWEQESKTERLEPGQLLSCFHNQNIVLPLITPEWIKKLTNGIPWSPIRYEIEEHILSILKKYDSKASIKDVYHLVDQRSLLPKNTGFRWKNFKKPEGLGDIKIHKKYLNRYEEEPDIPITVYNELIEYLLNEKLSSEKAKEIIKVLAKERVKFCPLKQELNVGQAVWIGMDVKTFSPFKEATDQRHQIPLVVTLYTADEIKEARNIKSLSHLYQFYLKRLERVCFEAYHQGAVLSTVDLNLMFFINHMTISRLVRKYIELTEIILPTPGTKKDCGKAISHKKIIIDKSLKGQLIKQIKSSTKHDPESIDRYLDTFQSVLILYIYEVPHKLMSKVLNTGYTVIKEYLEIIESYFDSREKMLGYLEKQGVKIP